MSEAEIMRRLDKIECRLPPPLCDKVGHIICRLGDARGINGWYACMYCGKDKMRIDREEHETHRDSILHVAANALPGRDWEGLDITPALERTITFTGESAQWLGRLCRIVKTRYFRLDDLTVAKSAGVEVEEILQLRSFVNAILEDSE